jgi:hypothetical protein
MRSKQDETEVESAAESSNWRKPAILAGGEFDPHGLKRDTYDVPKSQCFAISVNYAAIDLLSSAL